MNRQAAERLAWATGGVGLIGTAVGWLVVPLAFPHAWLAAVTVWTGWPLGCMALLLIHSVTGGQWGHALRPQLMAGMITLPLLIPAVIPLLFVLSSLYPWMRPGATQFGNEFYLNAPFFTVRAIVYLVIWFGLGRLILRALRGPTPDLSLARIAPAGLILLAISTTYASIDSTMSLDPHFASSAYGLIAMAEMGLLALAVSLFGAAWLPPPAQDVGNGLGQLLMALVLLWAYLDFMQVLIVWQSDLGSQAPWYVARSNGGWGTIAAGVATMHFLLPFLMLLSPRLRRSPQSIAIVAGLLIVGAVLHGWWLVVPAAGFHLGLTDVLAMLGVLGVAAALSLRTPLPPSTHQTVSGHG